MRRKLPVELEKQLKNIKDIELRKYYREQLKNHIAVIENYEKWIKEANEPFIFEDWGSKATQEDLYRRKIELIPHHIENRDRVKADLLKLKNHLEELENNA